MTIEDLPPAARCLDCGTWLPRAALECPNCGRPRDLVMTGLPDRQGSRRLTVVGGVGVVLALAVVMFLALGPHDGPGPSQSPPLGSGLADVSASPGPTPAGSPFVRQLPTDGPVDPGRYWMCVMCGTPGWVSLTIPAGYVVEGGRPALMKGGAPFPTLTMLDVTHVRAYVCADVFDAGWVEVGATVDALVTAMANQFGLQSSVPVDAMLGGVPAKKVELVLAGPCREGNRAVLWAGQDHLDAYRLGEMVLATVHIVEVDGQRVVLVTTSQVGGSAQDRAELDAMLASITIGQ